MILVEGAAMRMSKRSEYGLKAAVHLASHHLRSQPQGRRASNPYLQSREIADAERLPPKFLESVLLSLRSAQILVSKVGAGGGYRLSREPDEIMVHEVIDALERDHAGEEAHDEIGHTPTTFGARSEPPRSRATLPNGAGSLANPAGHAAIALLNRRIDEAVAGALGTMTLRELVSLTGPMQEQG